MGIMSYLPSLFSTNIREKANEIKVFSRCNMLTSLQHYTQALGKHSALQSELLDTNGTNTFGLLHFRSSTNFRRTLDISVVCRTYF